MVWCPLNDDTKNLTETDTVTFFPIPNFPKPIPRLFFRYQIFRNRYRDFFSDTKFSETDTETFFRYQIFRNQNRDFFSDTKFSETDTEAFFSIPNFPKLKPIPS